MVIRLFVPPGEGQHRINPRRPDPLGANATLQYSIVGSTGLAAIYTSFVSRYAQRLPPQISSSRTALFIRSSARLGLWGAFAGAAVNWYYHSGFTSKFIAGHQQVTPGKLYEWNSAYTIDDACVAGAAIGFAIPLATLSMRRLHIPRWTCCVGLTNIGACIGIAAGHGYFEYTGERQKAYKLHKQQLRRRTLEFAHIHWNEPLMDQFSTPIQLYILYNGIIRASLLPTEMFKEAERYAIQGAKEVDKKLDEIPGATSSPTEGPSWKMTKHQEDTLQNLRFDSQGQENIDKLEKGRLMLLKEVEYIIYLTTKKRYELHYTQDITEEQRRRLLRQLQFLLYMLDYQSQMAGKYAQTIHLLRSVKQQQAAMDASRTGDVPFSNWLQKTEYRNLETHDPSEILSCMEFARENFRSYLRQKEEEAANVHGQQLPEKFKRDRDDAYFYLKATDLLASELEGMRKESENQKERAREVQRQMEGLKGGVKEVTRDEKKG